MTSVITSTIIATILLFAVNTQNIYAPSNLTGAIFTTDSTCSGVDLNIYSSKADVFLNGGPQQGSAAGLPDGSYNVKVTEPDGTLLGDSSFSGVLAVVSGGIFTTCYNLLTNTDYDDTTNPGCEYKVWVSKNIDFPPNESKTDNFKVCEDGGGTPTQGLLTVTKFYDANGNGIRNGLEPLILGWPVDVTELFPAFTTFHGFTTFATTLLEGSYTVAEHVAGSPWIASTPTSVTPVLVTNGGTPSVTFGNFCLGQGGGMTLGFWSNKNGAALFGADDLALMVTLNLRNGAGNNFDPASYNVATPTFRAWLLSASATNMAYMLSAQLAAMELNVLNSKVSGTSLVYSPVLGVISINNLMSAANTELGLHGLTTTSSSDSSFRAYQEALKNALDAANNNLNFLQQDPTTCTQPIFVNQDSEHFPISISFSP